MFTFAHVRFVMAITAMFLVFAITAADGQVRRPMPTEALEKYEDPPTSFWGTGVSPARRVTKGGFTSHQVNVNSSGQNVVGDAANEPSITVDPTNGNKMAIGWRQFNSVTSNFRRAGWAYTTDGGMNWTFPGSIDPTLFRSDPVLYSDNEGKFYYLSLLESFFDTMYSSTNGGMTWLNPADATGGDKQWFVIDNTNSIGHGFQYQVWSQGGNNWGGRQFSRSIDGGQTWSEPAFILEMPSWGTPDVDADGNLFVGGFSFSTGQMWCVRSTDAKDGSVTPTFDQSTPVELGGDIGFQEPINPVGLVGQIFLAADRSGTITNNNVYMLASVIPTGFFTGSDVMFNRSTDSGQSFGKPIRINDDPVNHSKWHWMASMGVAPNGRIDAVWLDTRNAANNTDSQLFYSYSTDGGVTWSANVAVSDPFNPFLGYPNQNKIGDYLTIVSDNTGGDVAYPATFNGEEDVYYVRVAPAGGPTPTPTPTLTPSPSPTASITPTGSPTPGCCMYTGSVATSCQFQPGSGVYNISVNSVVNNPCGATEVQAAAFYLEGSADGVNFEFIARTSIQNYTFQPGANVINDSFQGVTIPSQYGFYRVRLQIFACGIYSIYSPVVSLCGPTPSQTPTVTPTATPTNTPTATPTATPFPIPELDLTITQSDAPDPVSTGQLVTYTLTVTNTPMVLGGVACPEVRFGYPSGVPVTFVSAGGTNGFVGVNNGITVTFNGGCINSNGSTVPVTATLNVVFRVNGPGLLVSRGSDVVVDPNHLVNETNPNNNIAQMVTTRVFPHNVISDFDGDHRSDISVFRPSEGNWYLQRSTAGFVGLHFGLGTDRIAPVDFDGDGKTDISVYRAPEGASYILWSSDGTLHVTVGGSNEDLPVPADYDGDGKAETSSFFRPSTGVWRYSRSSDTVPVQIQFGQIGDVPTLGDYDGDGKSDIAVFRPSNGVWYQLHSSTGGFFAQQFGLSTDRVVPADYDGDGKADLAVYRPSTGTWYVKNSATNTYSGYAFGLAADIPAPGDFDGDGSADTAVFRPSDGTWYITNSSNGSFTILQFGLNGDQPTQNAFGN